METLENNHIRRKRDTQSRTDTQRKELKIEASRSQSYEKKERCRAYCTRMI